MTLLDYGCGPGAFHKGATNGFKTIGYDINPFCGFDKKPHHKTKVDILTMWDVIEHLENPRSPIDRYKPEYLFICTPNVDSVKDSIINWKHYRPGEHLHYFDLKSLILLLGDYEIVEHNFEEGELRDPSCPKAIITVVGKRY